LPVIPPCRGNKEIKLIILGQDPTVKNAAGRRKITCTLNLDERNALRNYAENICDGLGITMENVYATNLFKYFYTIPPANTPDVLKAHLGPNLALLKQELAEFGNVPVITLGEPVLKLFKDDKAKVRIYWDYNEKEKKTDRRFACSQANDNELKRQFFPFPHQPSLRKEFYKETLEEYLGFVKSLNLT